MLSLGTWNMAEMAELKEQSKQTERQMRETDRRMQETDRRLKKAEDLFTTQWGRLCIHRGARQRSRLAPTGIYSVGCSRTLQAEGAAHQRFKPCRR